MSSVELIGNLQAAIQSQEAAEKAFEAEHVGKEEAHEGT